MLYDKTWCAKEAKGLCCVVVGTEGGLVKVQRVNKEPLRDARLAIEIFASGQLWKGVPGKKAPTRRKSIGLTPCAIAA